MATVAKRFGRRAFATAQPNLFVFRKGELHGSKFAAFVGTIAERLVFRFSTRAPPIIAGLEVGGIGRFLCNDWFHIDFLIG